jgi:hypothetical protein
MRRTLLSGLLLVAAALVTVLAGAGLDLEVDQTALLGVSAGAVVVLVPVGSVLRRFLGFALGVFLTLVGFFVRAALLPDTSAGRAVFGAVVVALCVVAAVASAQRLALWALLLGAATFAGAFESVYNAAPPQVAVNSISTLTALGLCVAMGFFAASFVAPPREQAPVPAAPRANDQVLEGTK